MTREEIIDGLYEIKNWHCDGNSKVHSIVVNAIEALEQEPCEDCISRKAAIEALKDWECMCTWDESCDEDALSPSSVIDELPSVQPKAEWIPCSERLPEEYGEYFITWTTSRLKEPLIAICEGEITSAYDQQHNRFEFEWLLEDYIKAYPDVEVVAWMPLPEAYKESEE